MPKEKKEPMCRDCHFWEGIIGRADTGECRRHAPVPYVPAEPEVKKVKAAWPATRDIDVCGEFKKVKKHEQHAS